MSWLQLDIFKSNGSLKRQLFDNVAGVKLPQFVVDENELENYFAGTTVPRTWARPRLNEISSLQEKLGATAFEKFHGDGFYGSYARTERLTGSSKDEYIESLYQ